MPVCKNTLNKPSQQRQDMKYETYINHKKTMMNLTTNYRKDYEVDDTKSVILIACTV